MNYGMGLGMRYEFRLSVGGAGADATFVCLGRWLELGLVRLDASAWIAWAWVWDGVDGGRHGEHPLPQIELGRGRGTQRHELGDATVDATNVEHGRCLLHGTDTNANMNHMHTVCAISYATRLLGHRPHRLNAVRSPSYLFFRIC